MITQIALLQSQQFNKELKQYCPGFYQFGDRIFGCWYTEGHGELNVTEAMAVSCDVYFYKTVKQLNLKDLNKHLMILVLGKKQKLIFLMRLLVLYLIVII